MTTSKTARKIVAARLPAPAKDDPESLVAISNQQIATVMACADYASQPPVQAVTTTLKTDVGNLALTLTALDKARAAIPPLEATRDEQVATVRRDRQNLAGAITVASAGSASAISAWGANASTASALPATTEAPVGLKATPSKTIAGTVIGKCTPVPGAATYSWSLSADGGAPVAQPLVTTGSKITIAGQATGHVLYLRVSVFRRHGGQSAWSDAAQITVR